MQKYQILRFTVPFIKYMALLLDGILAVRHLPALIRKLYNMCVHTHIPQTIDTIEVKSNQIELKTKREMGLHLNGKKNCICQFLEIWKHFGKRG